MDIDMHFYRDGKPMSLEEVNSEGGWRPPVFEIARAIEHYRKTKRKPFPDLMKTKFIYFQQEVGTVMTDQGEDILDDTFTEVILCDLDGKELQTYRFRSLSKRMTTL
jgi:hypothetical protein